MFRSRASSTRRASMRVATPLCRATGSTPKASSTTDPSGSPYSPPALRESTKPVRVPFASVASWRCWCGRRKAACRRFSKYPRRAAPEMRASRATTASKSAAVSGRTVASTGTSSEQLAREARDGFLLFHAPRAGRLLEGVELLVDAPPLLAAQRLVGHGEEDVVLLVDVPREQRGVGARRVREARPRGGIGGRPGSGGAQGGDELAALVVLVQHHPHRASVAGKAGFLQRGEEDLLLLVVVVQVGELAEELQDLLHRLRRHLRAAHRPVGQRLQHAQPAQDDLVLLHQELCRPHDVLSFQKAAEPVSARPMASVWI